MNNQECSQAWMATREEISKITSLLEHAVKLAEEKRFRTVITADLRVVGEDSAYGERILESVYY